MEKCKLHLEWNTTSVQIEWINSNSKGEVISNAVRVERLNSSKWEIYKKTSSDSYKQTHIICIYLREGRTYVHTQTCQECL